MGERKGNEGERVGMKERGERDGQTEREKEGRERDKM